MVQRRRQAVGRLRIAIIVRVGLNQRRQFGDEVADRRDGIVNLQLVTIAFGQCRLVGIGQIYRLVFRLPAYLGGVDVQIGWPTSSANHLTRT